MTVITDRWLELAQGENVRPLLTRGHELALGKASVMETILPLAELVLRSGAKVVGLGGPAGSGKSTLASGICAALTQLGIEVVRVSLDDFYLTKEERRRRRIRWRAVPGSHDMELLRRTLESLLDANLPKTVPQFDSATGDRGAPKTLWHVPQVVLVEGWFVGYRAGGYEILSDHLDLLVHLDLPIRLARQRRMEREDALRMESGGGISGPELEQFWNLVLGPGIDEWVMPARLNADVVLEFDADQSLVGCVLQNLDLHSLF